VLRHVLFQNRETSIIGNTWNDARGCAQLSEVSMKLRRVHARAYQRGWFEAHRFCTNSKRTEFAVCVMTGIGSRPRSAALTDGKRES
jgi:hypothetical protein